MRYDRIASAVLMIGMFTVSPASAQTAPANQAGAAQTIPDLSGIWEAPSELNSVYASGGRSDLCDEPACQTLLGIRAGPLVITVEEPQMLPWAEEKYKASRREGNPSPTAAGREEANPWFSACIPSSPAALTLSPFTAIELRQFPDVTLLLLREGDGNQAVRRVYMDGRGHPANLNPTWMGHSIGKYEGDALIVDTTGIKGNRWLDAQGHPHSEALHLVERFRRVDQSLEYEVTISDAQAYKNAWSKKVVRQRALPGPRFWDSVTCEELLQMGTHYGAEAR